MYNIFTSTTQSWLILREVNGFHLLPLFFPKIRGRKEKGHEPFLHSVTSQSQIHRRRGGVRCRFLRGESGRRSLWSARWRLFLRAVLLASPFRRQGPSWLFGAGSAMLLGKVVRTFGQGLISRRRPCPPEWALSSVEAILNGQGLYEKNRPCPKRLQTLPDMPEEMAHYHGPTVTCPQTKTPRMAARRLERKTRLELFLVIYWKSMFYTKPKRHQVKHRWNFRGFSGRMGEATSKDMERMCRVMKCHELPGRMMKGVPLDGGSSI